MFVRLSDDCHALIHECVTATNASRAAGEAPVTLGTIVERCVMQALQPGWLEGSSEPVVAKHPARMGGYTLTAKGPVPR